MVRNAFARANTIHMRATSLGCSASVVPDGSPMHNRPTGVGEPLGVNTNNVGCDIGETAATPPGQLFRGTSDTDMQSNTASSPGSNMSESSDSERQTCPEHGHGSGNGGDCDNDDVDGQLDSWDPAADSEDPPHEDNGDVSNDFASAGEDLEDWLGQIPNARMGFDP